MNKSTLLKYSFALLATLLVVGLYHFIDIRLFNLDVTQRTREHLFKIFSHDHVNESIVLLNSGKLEIGEIREKIDSLLTCEPAAIGVNVCSFDDMELDELRNTFSGNKKVIIGNCGRSGGSLASIVEEGNIVTHFKRDKDYFENKIDRLTNPTYHQRILEERKNDIELISFIDARKSFYRYDLNQIAFLPEFFSGKTILIGYMGEYLTDSVYYFDYCRITPMNKYYGYDHIEPDMYDIEITATIIHQLDNNIFINEIGQTPRILILFAICVLAVLILTLVKTRWLAVNIIIAFILFILLIVASGWVIVYLFSQDYYLNLDELPLALLIVTIFTVSLSVIEDKRRNQATGS